MARKNARRKRRNERKKRYETYEEALQAMRLTRLHNLRSGFHARARHLQVYPVRNKRTGQVKYWQFGHRKRGKK